MPIQILYNGDNIANDVEIKGIENVVYIEKKDIRTHLNNAMIQLIASGKIKDRIVD
jgi:DNA-binding TFAR19-related protein (PDSD5 family)